MMVEPATVDCAYIDGAYTDVPGSVLRVVTERLEECPRNGTLGRRGTPGLRSTPKEELLRDAASKCADRFSRRDAWRASPESLRETGVGGKGGKLPDVGEEVRGDEGVLVFIVELVVGRSDPLENATSCLAFKKTLNIGGGGVTAGSWPNEVELRLTYFASWVECAFGVNTAWFSPKNESKGKLSVA